MPFAPEYVQLVLAENFADAKRLFIGPLFAIHRAHLAMLRECGIVSAADAQILREAIALASRHDVRQAAFDGSFEDLFFHIEQLIVEACVTTAGEERGADVAGRLHTARSRNDIDMTMYRMRQREQVLDLFAAAADLRGALIGQAALHHESVFAAHTHTQRAQPTTLAHYLLAVIEQLERDAVRLKAAYETTNRCPLGACAITGTGFPIDRDLTARLLGFAAPTGNTYGSIATVDYVLESAAAIATLLVGLGRFVQDLLLWSTSEFGFLRLGPGFVQFSSIMPQKRNPVALEHARAIASKGLGQAQAVFTAAHNTPFGDIVDTEDDFQPLVFAMFHDANRAVRLVAATLAVATFDRAALEASTAQGWSTITELADTLVRDHDVSFRAAHRIARAVIEGRGRDAAAPVEDLLAAAAIVEGRPIVYTREALATILSARHFVAVRRTAGGPSPEQTRPALDRSRSVVDADRRWHAEAIAALARAEEERAAR